MYHDQGLAPLKAVAFDTGVNWTLGLPFIRTSPDHGTAYDIAGKGIANPVEHDRGDPAGEAIGEEIKGRDALRESANLEDLRDSRRVPPNQPINSRTLALMSPLLHQAIRRPELRFAPHFFKRSTSARV